MTSQPISLIRGQSHTATIRIELGGASLDLATASAATFTARPSEYSLVAKITKALGAGVTAGVAGLATVALTTGDTAELDISNSYSWMLTATVSDVEHIVARGVLTAIGAPQQFPDSGGTSGPVASADITDAGTAGIAVLQAETKAQGRTALGIGSALTPVTRTALSGTQVVLTEASAQAQVFTLTANTTVKLPAGGANTWAFAIFHGGGAFTLSINKADDTLLTALTAGDAATVVWDGTAPRAY